MYYYDVVASICTETCRNMVYNIAEGFKTEEEALKYITEKKISEWDYYQYCKDNETAYIEIEERDANNNSLVAIITVE